MTRLMKRRRQSLRTDSSGERVERRRIISIGDFAQEEGGKGESLREEEKTFQNQEHSIT